MLSFLGETLNALKEKAKEPEVPEPEPEPTTEVLFLCSYEGCGKTFIDAGALRKHSHIHGERQYVCHYEGCGKVLLCPMYFLCFCPYLFRVMQQKRGKWTSVYCFELKWYGAVNSDSMYTMISCIRNKGTAKWVLSLMM